MNWADTMPTRDSGTTSRRRLNSRMDLDEGMTRIPVIQPCKDTGTQFIYFLAVKSRFFKEPCAYYERSRSQEAHATSDSDTRLLAALPGGKQT